MTAGQIPIGRRGMALLAVTLTFIVLADWLFYGRPIGWTAGAFVGVVMAGVCVRQGRVASSGPAWVLVAGVVALAGTMVVEPGMLSVLLAAAGVGTWALSERLGWTASMRAWTQRAGGAVLWTVWQPIHDGRVQYRWQQRGDRQGSVVLLAMRNWLAPLLLTGVFVLLFRAANPILGAWVDDAGARLALAMENLDELLAPGRIVLWLGVGFAGWSLLRNRPTASRHDAYAPPPPPKVDHAATVDRYITTGLVVRCLVLFNALFALQTAMDVYYLWGGGALPEGMGYAEYAHRGAYPLVATALLAAAFVLVTFRSGGPAERSVWARRLVYLWIGQNIFLMASAAWRLQLYVDVYSLTRWRVAAAVWMLLVAIGLLWIIWRLLRHRDNAWLLRVNVVTAAAVLFACTFVNIDDRIAWFNVQHCAEITGEGAPIDVAYLEHLGVEAMPALAWLHAQPVPPDVANEVARAHVRLHDRLLASLADWRGWTWRRHQLAGESAGQGPRLNDGEESGGERA